MSPSVCRTFFSLRYASLLSILNQIYPFVFVGSGQMKKETEDDGTFISLTPAQNICDCHEMFLSHQTIQSIKYKSTKIKELIREYEEYYEAWLQRVRTVEHEGNGVTPQMV